MKKLQTTIGLEIHVQLATASKMFCRCNNTADNAKPNTLVCPVCLGLPGALPVANKQAIEWTIKTGLALNCEIPATAKFDRKHYFYPDLPKGYQISQYDEPFCKGGWIEIDNDVISSEVERSREILSQDFSNLETPRGRNDRAKIRLNRIHLEEDAGKLIHVNRYKGINLSNGDYEGGWEKPFSQIDLNRAGTPLMEIVTEPDITTPAMAGDFLRKLQKIVRDVVEVSEASMEKGHMRCDANISVSEMSHSAEASRDLGLEPRMSQIIEIKNLNSFKFVEKALAKAEEKLKSEFPAWPTKLTKETWGYNSDKDSIYLQRAKEEAADYRYFPEPDLPPIKSAEFDLEKLKSQILRTPEEKLDELLYLGLAEADAGVLVSNPAKENIWRHLMDLLDKTHYPILGRAIVHNYFPFLFDESDWQKSSDYAQAVKAMATDNLSKNLFGLLTKLIHSGKSYDDAIIELKIGESGDDIGPIVDKVLTDNFLEVERYKKGDTKLLGFFVGVVMKETKGSADPQLVNRLLKERL